MRRLSSDFPLFIMALFLLQPAAPASATNYSWINTSGGSWHIPTNWSPTGVPGSGDLAIITAAGNYSVTISNTTITVGAINLAGTSGTRTLQLISAGIDVQGGFVVGTRGRVTLNDSYLGGAGTLDLSGTLEADRFCTIFNNVTTATTSVITVNATSVTGLDFSNGFTNRGLIQCPDGSSHGFDVYGTGLVNASTGTITLGTGSWIMGGSGNWTLDNRGTITITGQTLIGNFSNPATTLHNSGTITVNSSVLVRVATLNTSGTIHINPGAEFWHQSGLDSPAPDPPIYGNFTQTAGIVEGGGALKFEAVLAVSFSSNPVVGQITLYRSNGTFPSPVIHGAGQQFHLTFATLAAPQFTIDAGHTLTPSVTTFNVPDFINRGTLEIPTQVVATGPITTQPGSSTAIGINATLTAQQGLTNNGDIGIERGATLLVADGYQLLNAPGAICAAINPDLSQQAWLKAQLNNQGLIAVNGNLTMDSPSANHENSGSITVGEGDLTLVQSGSMPDFVNTGAVYVNPDRALRVNGGSLTFLSGSLTGNGSLFLTGTQAVFSVFPLISALDMTSATGTFPGTFNTDDTSIDLENSTLTGSFQNTAGHTVRIVGSTVAGSIENAGTLDVQGSSNFFAFLYNQGLLTIQDGLLLEAGGMGYMNLGVIRVLGGKFRISHLPPAGYFSNEDTLRVASDAELEVSGGIFTNTETGVLAGPGTLDFSAATFVNNGTINPGASPGTMTISGHVTMGPTSVLNMEIGGSSGSEYDQIVISGAAALDGALNILLVNGFSPQPGDAFDLVSYAGHNGTFDAINGTEVGDNHVLTFVPQIASSGSAPIRLTAVSQFWSQQAPFGGPPAARREHVSLYTGLSNRMIVFGGESNGGALNDTWVLTNANGNGGAPMWLQLSPAGPLPPVRRGAMAAYDETNNRLIVYGGQAGVGLGPGLQDVWILSNANGLGGVPSWTEVSPGGGTPGPRTRGGVAYNPVSNRLILFGGVNPDDPCGQGSNDVWILTNANGLDGPSTWNLQTTSGSPPNPRSGCVVGYDRLSNRLVIHGGQDACAGVLFESRYLANADGTAGTPEWTMLNLFSPLAPGRVGHGGFFDAMTDRLVTWGGLNPFEVRQDATLLVLNASGGGSAGWASLPVPLDHPSARFGHSLVWDPASRRMTLFGGDTEDGLVNDVWILDLDLDPEMVSGVQDPPPANPSPQPDLGADGTGFDFQRVPFPNPSSGRLTFTLEFAEAGEASVSLVDVTGRRVARLLNEPVSAGRREVAWNGEGEHGHPLPSGIYYIVVEFGGRQATQRVAIVR